ncbi:copper resistance CopC family protein [Aeromicrobium choanae]|uniref:Copper transport protein n=1 Tax=Aeromicrobium choanae TaxID=1736691 RepID=A0A1T4YMD4_9ACTN|nr:copper resistance protein CopC [Aeromicrobium choanae]SKB02997.1 copper transport protein [Aeromicrobium choanae]
MTHAPVARRARLAAVLSGLLLLLVWPVAAFGHASPIGSNPADGQVLTQSPAELTVTFTEPVSLAGTGNAVLDAAGETEAAEFSVRDTVLRIRPAEPLADGTHVVTWRVVSADSHPVSGGFTFAIGAATPGAIGVPTTETERELVVARTVVEALRYAGALGVAGLVVFSLFIAPGAARRQPGVERRTRRTTAGLGALAVLAAVLLMPLTAVWESGGPLSSVMTAEAWRDGATSSAGLAALVLTAGVAAALLGRAREPVLAAVGAALVVASLLQVGHTRSYGPWWLVLTADLVHVSAGALWWGGLLGLGLVLAAGPALRVQDRAAAVARFSAAAGVTLVALAVAGVVLFWRIAGSFPALWETGYGRAVLVKVLLLVPVVAVAAWNRRVLVGRLSGREASSAAELLRRTVSFEAVVVAAVLVATGALVGQTPPARSDTIVQDVPTVQRLELDLGESHRVDVVVSPVRQGTNAIQVTLTDTAGDVVDLEETPRLQIALEEAEVGPINRPLVRTRAGHWEGTADLPLPGAWRLSVSARLTRFDEPVVSGEVEIP